LQEHDWLAERFEANRGHLRAVAYRMLGSLSEAEDAVQEAWLRLARSDTSEIANLEGWLTTVVGRVSLDMLRMRKTRREESLNAGAAEPLAHRPSGASPEDEAVLADSVGLALLVVLNTLSPAERLAFVLHDMFAVPFDEIAPIVDRSPAATRQLASRARRRVQGTATATDAELSRQRTVVDAFLTAARAGDLNGLLSILDPEIVFRDHRVLMRSGGVREVRGATVVAGDAMKGGARAARPVLVNDKVGVVIAPRGRLLMVLDFTITEGKVSAIDLIAGPERLAELDLKVLPD